MKLFIWEDTGNVSNNYHDGGGLLVCAATLERAREIIPTAIHPSCGALTEEPDHVWNVPDATEEKAIAFPDAGCC